MPARLYVSILLLLVAGTCNAGDRPSIDWSVSFSNGSDSSQEIGAVAFSETEPDMVYFAGSGHAHVSPSDPTPVYPYTRLLPDTLPQPYTGYASGIFVGKMNYKSNTVEFLTFVVFDTKLAATLTDLAFDADGNIFLVGYLTHFAEQFSYFPALNPIDGCRQPGASGLSFDGIFIELNADASQILRSCFYGGSGNDRIRAIDTLPGGGFVMAGETESSDLYVENPLQSGLSGTSDAFLAAYGPDSSMLIGTWVGGSGGESLTGVHAMANGTVLLSGSTSSSDFPATSNAYQASSGGGFDAILLEIDPSDVQRPLQYASYFGGVGNDSAQDIAADASGNVYFVGTSNSPDYPIVGENSESTNGYAGATVTKLDRSLSTIMFSTARSHPNTAYISGESIAVSSEGDIVIAGQVENADWYPMQSPLLELDDPDFEPTLFWDAHVIKWIHSAAGYELDFATLLGAPRAAGFRVDIKGRTEILLGGLVSNYRYADTTYQFQAPGAEPGISDGPVALVISNDLPRSVPPNGGGGSGSGGGGAAWLLATLLLQIACRMPVCRWQGRPYRARADQ